MSRWTEEELSLAKKNTMPPSRSFNGFRNKVSRMGLRTRRATRPKWSQDQIEKLNRLASEGHSARSIHKSGELFQSVNAIQKMMCRIGLAKKNKVFKFPHEVREKFKSFLVQNWRGKTPEDLNELWNKENARFPSNKRKVIAALTKLKIKISYGEVQKINNLRKKEKKIMKDGSPHERSSSGLAEKIRMERANLMRLRLEQNKNIWTGLFEPESECA
jgi:hypothetical protein